jgi:HEPN domain-containing protein
MIKNNKKLASYWLKAAGKDLEVMDSLMKNRHHSYALYFGHLALEKILKGYYVSHIDKVAPYTHNLHYLAEKCRLKLSNSQLELIQAVTRFNIEARYPYIKFKFYKMCTREFTTQYIKKIKEFYKWLKSIMK